MQIYFHRHLFSHLSRVPILVEGTVYIYIYIYIELHSRNTALIHNHKSTLFACVLKPCRLSFSFTRWSDVRFFRARAPEVRELKSLSNSA